MTSILPLTAARGTGARLAGLGLAALACLSLGSCYIDTQQFPGFLRPVTTPLPKGELETFPRGPEEAYVTRHTLSLIHI